MNVLILFDSAPLALKVVYCLAAMRANIHAVGSKPDSPLRLSRHVQHYEALDLSASPVTVGPTVAKLNDIIDRKGIDAIVPVDIGPSGFLASVRDELQGTTIFPCSSPALLDKLHDKSNFACFMREQGLPHPRTMTIESPEAIDREEIKALGTPFLVKPLAGESGHGVVKKESFEELTAYLAQPNPYNKPPLIAQQFVPGRDIGVSILAIKGELLTSTTQLWDTTTHGAGRLEMIEHPESLDIARRIIRISNYSGVAHFDMRLGDDGGVSVLECNPRFWYSLLASRWHGVNFVELGIRAARGQPLQSNNDYRYVLGRYFLTGEVIRHPLYALTRLSKPNLQSILQVVSDPLPQLHQLARK